MNPATKPILAPILAIVIALGALIPGHAARAQEEHRLITVENRPRPESDPVGIRAGGFLIVPTITVSESYEDNITAVQTNTRDDLITDIGPVIAVKSNWNRHSLNASASANIAFYASNSDENFEDYAFVVGGRFDALRDTYMTGSVGYAALHESRASVNDAGGDEPGLYSLTSANMTIFNGFNRFALSAGAVFTRYDYDDVTVSGVVDNQDDRDLDRIDVNLRGGYEIFAGYQGFLKLNLNDTSYKTGTDDLGFKRGSDGYEIVGGVRIDLTGITSGDIFAGYLSHDFIESSFATIEGFTVGADLTWNVTELTTVYLVLDRSISETSGGSSSGTFNTNFDISADHELLRHLILSAQAGVGMQDFEGISRKDKVYRFAVGAKYLVNRNLDLRFDYDFNRRTSDAANSGYTINVFMLRAVGKL